MDFGEILKKAWQIIWKNKILWLFGLLASCGSVMSRGNGGNGNAGGGGSPAGPSSASGAFPFFNSSMQDSIDSFVRTIESIQPWVWVIIAMTVIFVGVILAILFLFLGTLGTTGVIKGTSLADEADPDAKPLSFGTIFKAIKPYFWKVLLLNLGIRIVGFFVILFLALPILIFTVCTCFLGIFLLIPLGWFVEMMVTFTTIAIIEEDQDIFSAIGRAWQLTTKKLGYVVAMFLILGIGKLIVGLLIGLPLILVPLPLLINLFGSGFQTFSVGLIVSIILLIVMVPVMIFLGGVLKAYVLASWTLTYRRIAEETDLEPTVVN
jgi:hypothetical protein